MATERVVNENTQSKYRKKNNQETDQASIEQNEVRITTQGQVKRYVDYAVRLLNGSTRNNDEQNDNDNDNDNEETKSNAEETSPEKDNNDKNSRPIKKFDTILLKATGRAIFSAVTTAEVVKRKVANLHQMTLLDTLEISDVWEPLEEGLKEVKTTRRVASIVITLTRNSSDVDTNAIGYQEPIVAESVSTPGRGRGRGRGRGGGRGRGRGRGQGQGQGQGQGRGQIGFRNDFYDSRRPNYRGGGGGGGGGMGGGRQPFIQPNTSNRRRPNNRGGGGGGFNRPSNFQGGQSGNYQNRNPRRGGGFGGGFGGGYGGGGYGGGGYGGGFGGGFGGGRGGNRGAGRGRSFGPSGGRPRGRGFSRGRV